MSTLGKSTLRGFVFASPFHCYYHCAEALYVISMRLGDLLWMRYSKRVISLSTDIDDDSEDVGENEEVALHVTNGRLGATLHTQPTNSSI